MPGQQERNGISSRVVDVSPSRSIERSEGERHESLPKSSIASTRDMSQKSENYLYQPPPQPMLVNGATVGTTSVRE